MSRSTCLQRNRKGSPLFVGAVEITLEQTIYTSCLYYYYWLAWTQAWRPLVGRSKEYIAAKTMLQTMELTTSQRKWLEVHCCERDRKTNAKQWLSGSDCHGLRVSLRVRLRVCMLYSSRTKCTQTVTLHPFLWKSDDPLTLSLTAVILDAVISDCIHTWLWARCCTRTVHFRASLFEHLDKQSSSGYTPVCYYWIVCSSFIHRDLLIDTLTCSSHVLYLVSGEW